MEIIRTFINTKNPINGDKCSSGMAKIKKDKEEELVKTSAGTRGQIDTYDPTEEEEVPLR